MEMRWFCLVRNAMMLGIRPTGAVARNSKRITVWFSPCMICLDSWGQARVSRCGYYTELSRRLVR